jgi:lipopolysaccharide transport system ATP-binding protein
MRKDEIKRKFDEIVSFAGVERYIDTPVKRYSSGMYVRLAFAVAAHLESEIIILDEVLAVGDAEFQKKCLGKMGDVSHKEGRTVLFVSHNIQAVQSLCNKGILLKDGHLEMTGDIKKVASFYINDDFTNIIAREWEKENAPGGDEAKLMSISITTNAGNVVTTNTPVSITFKTFFESSFRSVYYSIQLFTEEGHLVFDTVSDLYKVEAGYFNVRCEIPGDFLNDGIYYISINLHRDGSVFMVAVEHVLQFKVEDGQRHVEWYGDWMGMIRPKFTWTHFNKEEI